MPEEEYCWSTMTYPVPTQLCNYIRELCDGFRHWKSTDAGMMKCHPYGYKYCTHIKYHHADMARWKTHNRRRATKHTTTTYTYFVHMEMCKKGEGFFELGKAPHRKGESIKLESMKIQSSWAEAKYAQRAEPGLNILVSLAVHEGLRVEVRRNKVSRTRQPGKGRTPQQLLQPTHSIPLRADPVSSYNLLPPISVNTQAITWASGEKKKPQKKPHRQIGKTVSTQNQSWKSSTEVKV